MTIQAGQIVGPRRIEMVSRRSRGPAGGQIRVRPRVGCLGGSDLPYFLVDSANPMIKGRTAPMDPGLSLHELIGVVDASRCSQYREGDWVLALPYEHHG